MNEEAITKQEYQAKLLMSLLEDNPRATFAELSRELGTALSTTFEIYRKIRKKNDLIGSWRKKWNQNGRTKAQ